MGRKRPIEVFVDHVEPLVVFPLLQLVLILTFAAPEASTGHEGPGKPSIGRRRSLPQPVPKLLGMVIVEVAKADPGIA